MGLGNTRLDLGIEEIGDWASIERFFEVASNKSAFRKHVKYGMRDFLRSYRWWAIKGLVTSGAAVQSSWLPRALDGEEAGIRTSHYLNAIQAMKISMKGNTVSLRFNPSDLSKKSIGGKSLEYYMDIFEHGNVSGTQPARPLWGPSWKKAGGYTNLTNLTLRATQKYFLGHGLMNVNIREL